ncbi:MAG: T9SS type A sorting domain-containing protein [bacterium]
MKKKFLLMLMFILPAITLSLFAQGDPPMATMKVPYKQLILTEVNHGGNTESYVEFTNVGDSTINLKDFYWVGVNQRSVKAQNVVRDEDGVITNIYWKDNDDALSFYTPLNDQLLKPGESYVGMPVFDRTNEDGSLIQNKNLVEIADHYLHPAEPDNDLTIEASSYPEYQNFAFDSVSFPGAKSNQNNRSAFALAHHSRMFLGSMVYNDAGEVIDSVAIDGFKLIFLENFMGDWNPADVAGVVGASNLDYSFARKAIVTQGNLNWEVGRGSTRETSEWILLPKIQGEDIFTTIGTHGNFAIDASSSSVIIDNAGETMEVPFGVYKGDSLINEMTLGPGMAWKWIGNRSNFMTQGFTTVQSGDTVTLYAAGNDLDSINYTITLKTPPEDENRVFEKYKVNPEPPIDPETGEELALEYFDETEYDVIRLHGEAIDSINRIPFQTRVDTLFKYLEKPENASWDIVWVDGKERPDLKFGDILRVTAENGTTRDYFLNIEDYLPSENAQLASITWPDKPGFLMDWKEDTIPYFDPAGSRYTVSLPYNYESVPALVATVQDPNASVQMEPAKTLIGTNEDRTTQFVVTAEDGSTVSYYVTFMLETPRKVRQPWGDAEPFISEMAGRTPTNNDMTMEIYNPGTEAIDLSNYIFVPVVAHWSRNVATIVENMWETTSANNAYIPGMKWPEKEELEINPGIMVFDPAVDPILDPGKTFTMMNAAGDPDNPIFERVDVVFISNYADTAKWKEAGGNQWGHYKDSPGGFWSWNQPGRTNLIFKIKNDSIRQSLKSIGDPEDLELIDQLGFFNNPAEIAGKSVGTNTPSSIRRKPHVYAPNPEQEYNFYPNSADSSDWILTRLGDIVDGIHYTENDMLAYDIGVHHIDPVTFYSSVIYSDVYKVDDGYKGDIYVRGVSNGETVTDFLNNLKKADAGQSLVVLTAIDGDEKAASEEIIETDLLSVTSSDGKNTTIYKITLEELDDNNTLTLVSGSDLTITRGDGDEGVISDFTFGESIKNVLDDIKVPGKATLSVINEAGELLPLTVLNNDTVKVETKIDSDVYFRVRAENGDVAIYHLDPEVLSSEAYVISSVYDVIEETSTINHVSDGTSVSSFLANIHVVPGATVKILDKQQNERTLGKIAYDDYITVTSEDETVTRSYLIQFINEEGDELLREPAPAPQNLRLVSVSEEGTVSLAWDYDFGLEYGFVIERDDAIIDTVMSNSFEDEGLTVGGTYNYTVYAYNEFGNTSALDITVVAWPTSVDTKEAKGISIYPNVTTDMIYFRNLPENSRVAVIDLAGRSVLMKNASDLSDGISLKPYEKGYYLIKVLEGNKNVKSLKVILK